MTAIRTRFAPSPTGYLHVGGIRTAVFAWLIATQSGGQFVLRLEDTDKKREVSGSDSHLMESLKALGLFYQEGPDIGGPYAPYRQSERLEIYKHWAERLVTSGRAYADPYSPAEVQSFRQRAQAEHRPFLYRTHRPVDPPVWDGSQPLRFKSDPKTYTRRDEIMGQLTSGPESIDDFILIKSDGYPTYNFAHIVDDHEMNISLIIRGQEFLASIPNYLNLYEALDIVAPAMATAPHILGPDGKKKLSKRDGAKDVLDYIRDGILPDALLNFITSLGWNDGTEQEIYSREQLVRSFRLDRVGRSGANFDERRLLWMNGSYIRALSLPELNSLAGPYWPASAADYDDDYRSAVLGLIQERLKFLAEIPELTACFFEDLPIDPGLISGHKQLSKLPSRRLIELLRAAALTLTASDFTIDDIADRLNQLLEETKEKPAVLFSLIRIASTQAPSSPSLANSLSVLGKIRTLSRISAMLVWLETTTNEPL
jgi:glutamyl-tRNA synthetase